MRRLVGTSLVPAALAATRGVVVGPSKSIPQAKSVPQFGKKAKATTAAATQRARPAEPSYATTAEMEAAAEKLCGEKYDFLERPICVDSWQQFKRDLQRLELRWSLEPGAGGVFVLKIYDHSEPGDGLLCELKGSGNLCTPIADFFDACGQLIQGATTQHDVRFANGSEVSLVRLVAKRALMPPGTPSASKNIMCIPQYDCRGTQVDIRIVDERSGLETPLFHNIPLQVVNYHFVTSIPVFLKRNDIGVKNTEFVTKNQMQHFRFAWCFLRRESWMTPVEMGELDNLLPP